MNKYYDFNGYCRKTTNDLYWALYTDCTAAAEITLIFDEYGDCIGVENADHIRILISIENIPRYADFSIKGCYQDE